MLDPMRDKTEGTHRGGEGTTPETAQREIEHSALNAVPGISCTVPRIV